MGRDHRGEDASCCHKVGEIHEEDCDSTLSFLGDEGGVFQSFSGAVELADGNSRTERADHTVQSTDDEASHYHHELSVVVVRQLLQDQQNDEDDLVKEL